MTQRYQTTAASGDSAAFTTGGDTIFQLDTEDKDAVVNILARVDVGAKWVSVAELRSSVNLSARLAYCPQFMISVTRNTEGKTLTVWSDV